MSRYAFPGDTLLQEALIEAAGGDEPWLNNFMNSNYFRSFSRTMTIRGASGMGRLHFFDVFQGASADISYLVEAILRESGHPFPPNELDMSPDYINPRRTARKAFAQVATERGVALDQAFMPPRPDHKSEASLFDISAMSEADFYATHPANEATQGIVAETMQRADRHFALRMAA